jgi:hypothetical protein
MIFVDIDRFHFTEVRDKRKNVIAPRRMLPKNRASPMAIPVNISGLAFHWMDQIGFRLLGLGAELNLGWFLPPL